MPKSAIDTVSMVARAVWLGHRQVDLSSPQTLQQGGVQKLISLDVAVPARGVRIVVVVVISP